ncbi:hypothetical protein GHO41_23980 [Pseudomonas sp. FSL R10-0399]|uniref:hypothetical protein n=1 Tax=Pseudomonas sp. FSL R10-0399 TaxID=2662194 RepID=UPI001298171C|nr:hypothetical protein [Pseudomonas sp. FSL R10-0399]MQT60388.1 hypothetical protein [Pseudomonas sp. FSL R10-0399]
MSSYAGRSSLKRSAINSIGSALFILLGAVAPAYGAALCNGGPALLGGVACDMLPIGGGSALCLFIGVDKNANGRVEGGTSDTCILIDANNKQHPGYSCTLACQNTNGCSRPQCLSLKKSGSK